MHQTFLVPSEIKAKNREEKISLHPKVVHQVAALNPTHGQTGSCEGSDEHLGHAHHVKQQGKKLKVRKLLGGRAQDTEVHADAQVPGSTCDQCGRSFSTTQGASAHIPKVHGSDPAGEAQVAPPGRTCNQCGRTFATTQGASAPIPKIVNCLTLLVGRSSSDHPIRDCGLVDIYQLQFSGHI